MDNRPIGMFDSGIGGLTVLKEYRKRMPNEDYLYYADTKHMPYGNKTKDEIIAYAESIVQLFLSKNVKAIIIACGTSSSLAYPYLKENYEVPLFDIISPAAQAVTGKEIGVIATQATIQSNVWEKRIRDFHPQVQIYSQACPHLASLAEKNWQNTFLSHYWIHQYLKSFKQKHLDCLILRMYSLSFVSKRTSKGIRECCFAYQYWHNVSATISNLFTRK